MSKFLELLASLPKPICKQTFENLSSVYNLDQIDVLVMTSSANLSYTKYVISKICNDNIKQLAVITDNPQFINELTKRELHIDIRNYPTAEYFPPQKLINTLKNLKTD